MLSVNTNISSLIGAQNLNNTQNQISLLTQQISTGKRILSAADDPAGVGILSTLKSQDASYTAVQKNLAAGTSLLKVAETSLGTQQGILKQMKDLATQASSQLLSSDQRTALQSQFGELQKQMDSIVNKASLFGQNLTGASSANVSVQSGINSGDTYSLTSVKSDGATLGIDSGTIDLTDTTKAAAAMAAIDTAVGTVAGYQSTIGTQLTGMQTMTDAVKNTQLNVQSSISSIEDADVASLSTQLAQLQTKQQLQTQALSITNQLPQSVLSLFR